MKIHNLMPIIFPHLSYLTVFDFCDLADRFEVRFYLLYFYFELYLNCLLDRMPVILGNMDAAAMWLSGSPSSNIYTLLKPYEESDLVIFLNNQSLGKEKSVVDLTCSCLKRYLHCRLGTL